MAEIRWDTAPDFDNLGRNGYSKARGVSLVKLGDVLMVEGINSRGDITAVRIVIPADQIDSVIAGLQEEKART